VPLALLCLVQELQLEALLVAWVERGWADGWANNLAKPLVDEESTTWWNLFLDWVVLFLLVVGNPLKPQQQDPKARWHPHQVQGVK